MDLRSVLDLLLANVPELEAALHLFERADDLKAKVHHYKGASQADYDPSSHVPALNLRHKVSLAENEAEQDQDEEFVRNLDSCDRWRSKRLSDSHDRDQQERAVDDEDWLDAQHFAREGDDESQSIDSQVTGD